MRRCRHAPGTTRKGQPWETRRENRSERRMTAACTTASYAGCTIPTSPARNSARRGAEHTTRVTWRSRGRRSKRVSGAAIRLRTPIAGFGPRSHVHRAGRRRVRWACVAPRGRGMPDQPPAYIPPACQTSANSPARECLRAVRLRSRNRHAASLPVLATTARRAGYHQERGSWGRCACRY